MNLLANFTYTVAKKIYSKTIPVKLEKDSLTLTELSNQLQKYSPNPHTTVISSISQGNNTWAKPLQDEKGQFTLQENTPLEVTLTPLELTKSLPNEILPHLFKRLDDKTFADTQLAAKSFSQRVATIYAAFPASVSLFNQPPESWKLVTTKQYQTLIARLAEPTLMEQLLSFVNAWIQSENGAKHFYKWIAIFGQHFINFYKHLSNPTVHQTALFALITNNFEQLKFNKVKEAAIAITTNFPAIAKSLNTTVTVLKEQRVINSDNSLVIYYYNLQGARLGSRKNGISRTNGINFSNASLPGANFAYAKLKKTTFINAELSNANFFHANCSHTNFFKVVTFGANFTGTNLSSAYLANSDCRGAKFLNTEFNNANFTDANCLGANFSGTVFSKVLFQKTNLSGIDLTNRKFINSSFLDANLSKTKFTGAQFCSTYFSGADLSYADLSNAILISCDLSHARLFGANLENCFFGEYMNLTNTNLANANIKNIKGLDKIEPSELASAQQTTLTELKKQIAAANNFTQLLTIYLANNTSILFISLPASIGSKSAFFAPIPITYANEFLNTIRDRASKILSTTKVLSPEEQTALVKLNELVKLPSELQATILQLTNPVPELKYE